MPDKAKETFANNLRHLLAKNDLTQVDFSEQMDFKTSTLSDWINGRKYPRVDSMQAIADFFKIPMSDLMKEESSSNETSPYIYDFEKISNLIPITTKQIPLIGQIACGEPAYADEDFEGYVEVGADIHVDFALKAKGDSMINIRIHDGDIVFVQQTNEVSNGDIAVVLIDDEATLKRFRRVGDIIVLSPENPAYTPIEIRPEDNSSIRILGKAIAFQSDIK